MNSEMQSDPRAMCGACGRPVLVCVCALVSPMPTRSRVLLLQHPRERRVGVGTARLAHLSLPNSDLRVGLDFSRDPVVAPALASSPPPYLLFPGADAVALQALPRDGFTLIVVDGTWAQARKLLRLNPALAALPRVAFTPDSPSEYEIRRQPRDFCVSTIEALAEVMAATEPERVSRDRLLAPFRAMVDKQKWFERTVNARRHSHKRVRVTRRPTLGEQLRERFANLVCVQGDANGWPAGHPDRQPAEVVHWLAHRPATGESYGRVVATRHTLAPRTPFHVGLDPACLSAGVSSAAWQQSWRGFLRPDDLLVTWGVYYTALAVGQGLHLPESHWDLRSLLAQKARMRPGTIEQALARQGAPPAALGLPGRAGQRLAALVGLVDALAATAAA